MTRQQEKIFNSITAQPVFLQMIWIVLAFPDKGKWYSIGWFFVSCIIKTLRQVDEAKNDL